MLHVLYHIWSHLRIRIIGGVTWDLGLASLIKCPLFLNQVFWLLQMTVLMFITYHHNFCSHHGHHLCRGKIGDMMAFPLSPLGAQSSPTSPSSVCTPGCTTMVEMSHTRKELVFAVRDQWTDDSAGLTGELADEWRHFLITCNQLQNLALCLRDQIVKRKLKKKFFQN